MAALQNEVCTKDFFRGADFLTKKAPIFSPKLLSLNFVGLKNHESAKGAGGKGARVINCHNFFFTPDRETRRVDHTTTEGTAERKMRQFATPAPFTPAPFRPFWKNSHNIPAKSPAKFPSPKSKKITDELLQGRREKEKSEYETAECSR